LPFQGQKGKDQEARGSASSQPILPTLPPQTSGVCAGTGQRAMSMFMALVCAEIGSHKTEE